MTVPVSRVSRLGRGTFWSYSLVVAGLGWLVIVRNLLDFAAPGVGTLGVGFWLLAGLVLGGELRKLVTAGGDDSDGLTVSTTFVFAVLLHWGMPAAVVVQTVATLVDHAVNRRPLHKALFNAGQYALSWSAAAAVLVALGRSASTQNPLGLAAGDLVAVALAGAAYVVVNQALVVTHIALRSGESWASVAVAGLGYQLVTNAALLGLAPLVVVVAKDAPGLTPLLLLPLAAVYRVAGISVARERESQHDALTGLANRRLLATRTTQALADAQRRGRCVGFILLDLDRFKEVNDSYGHPTGDRLLQVLADRLSGAVRDTDTLARLGGDEFAVVMPDLPVGAQAETAVRSVLGRIRDAFEEPVLVEVGVLAVSVSAGVAMSPADGENVDQLLQHADIALYQAKEAPDRIVFYAGDHEEQRAAQVSLAADLRQAVRHGALHCAYQPKLSLTTGEVVGVEALLRWDHPQRGPVAPDEFIPLAEAIGLMPALTDWVLDAAVQQVRDWSREGLQLAVSVNVSVINLVDPAFLHSVEAALARYRVASSCLRLEVTESRLMADQHDTSGVLASLAALGVELSLDDFGTGYSSLTRLRRMPVAEVKIDRSFVTELTQDDADAAVIRCIVALAHSFGLSVVAEGVETVAAWDVLRDLGCDAAQGWLITRALPGDQLARWCAGHRAAAVTGASRGAVVPGGGSG